MAGHLNGFLYLNPYRYNHIAIIPLSLTPSIQVSLSPICSILFSRYLLFHIEYRLVCCGVLGVVVYSAVIHLNAHRAEEVVYLSSSP